MLGAQYLGLQDLSKFLGFAPQRIFYLVKYSHRSYTQISIPKKNDPGSSRDLFIPTLELKGVQRSILKNIIEKIEIGQSARAYVKGLSLAQTGHFLSGNSALMRLDLTDFFPTISDRRVFGLFSSLGFNGSCSYILTRLCTLSGCLPQGSPASPAISNVIARWLDTEIRNLSFHFGLKYFRYSDDMFFVGKNNFDHKKVIDAVLPIIHMNGFVLNADKTAYFPRGAPRTTLGLVTHGNTPKLPREFRRNLRAAFFQASRNVEYALANMAVLRGSLEWYKSIYGRDKDYEHFHSVLRTASKVKIHNSYRSI